jgi:putative tricarboxylic transport membrane protein
MDLLANLSLGFSIALSPYTLLLAIIGCFLGTIIGALPGLGPSNGVAILIPLTFTLGLDATSALVLMTSVYYGAMYGGRISSILLNIPGDEPALMTTLDGYPMAKAGRAGDALILSGFASFVGATLATIGLMLLAPLLARVAYLFGPAEYFALYLLAFCTLGGMASNNQAKAAIASCIGLGIAMIGVDNTSGMPRLTGGNLHLYDGIDFLVAIVGLFAVLVLWPASCPVPERPWAVFLPTCRRNPSPAKKQASEPAWRRVSLRPRQAITPPPAARWCQC